LKVQLGDAALPNITCINGSAAASTRILGVHTYACGIGVRLRQVLDYALAALAARGTYTNLYLKYFPLGFY
jgi:hypothetical protein